MDTYFRNYFNWLAKSGCQNHKFAGNTFSPFPSFCSPGNNTSSLHALLRSTTRKRLTGNFTISTFFLDFFIMFIVYRRNPDYRNDKPFIENSWLVIYFCIWSVGWSVGSNAGQTPMLLWPLKMLKSFNLYLGRRLMIQLIRMIEMINMIHKIHMIYMIQVIEMIQMIQMIPMIQMIQMLQADFDWDLTRSGRVLVKLGGSVNKKGFVKRRRKKIFKSLTKRFILVRNGFSQTWGVR